MALPLPKVVADVGPGGPFVTSARGLNALRKEQSEAQYAPYTNYANALSKMAYAQYSPLDIQAKLLSNPALLMAIKDDPKALAALTSNTNTLMKRMQTGGNDQGMIGGINLPGPGQMTGGSLAGNAMKGLSYLYNKFMGGNANENPMASPGSQAANPVSNVNPSVPSAGGNTGLFPSRGLGGYVDIQTAPLNKQIYKPGESYIGPDGKVHSVPSSETVTGAQSAILATQRVTPQLERLAQDAAPFMTLQGQGKVGIAKLKNILGGKSNLPSQYEKFHAEIQAAPESLLKTYGLKATNETIERMQKVIEPHFGESAGGYKNRILTTLEEIRKEQKGTSEKALSEGLQVSDQNENEVKGDKNAWPLNKLAKNEKELEGQVPPPDTVWMIRPDGMKVPVHLSQQSIAKNKYHYRGI